MKSFIATQDGVKSLSLTGTSLLDVLRSGSDGGATLNKSFQNVPWLYRGAQLRMQAISSLPFAILKGEDELDTSADYQNKIKFMPNPGRVFSQIEGALTLFGRAYVFMGKNRSGFLKQFRFLQTDTIKDIKFDNDGKPVMFERMVEGVGKVDLTPEELLYFWLPDPTVEDGPPRTSPGLAALQAAGVLMSVDKFVDTFFKRGAVKATVFSVPGTTPDQERSRFRDWLRRMFGGVDQSNSIEVLNSDAAQATTIGEGISELSNVSLTNEKREDIATALGVPQTLLFSNAANYATAKQDDISFMAKTIVPEAHFIAGVLNEQLFEPIGLRFEFRPEELEVFQEEEVNRSAAFANYARFMPVDVVGQILGVDLPADMTWEQVAERSNEYMASRRPEIDTNPQEIEEDGLRSHLDKWQRKSLKKFREKGIAAVKFESEHIGSTLNAAIMGALEAASSSGAVARAFGNALEWEAYP